MTDSWSVNSMSFADLDLRRLVGGSGLGFYRLIAEVAITTHPRDIGKEIVVADIAGDLYVSAENNRNLFFVGHLTQAGGRMMITTYPHMGNSTLSLDLDLGGSRVEAIERVRLGGNLSFAVDLYGIAKQSGNEVLHPVRARLNHTANQSTWIEILRQMGYRQMMLLEIPTTDAEENPRLSEAAKNLKAAQAHMLRGHFRDAVGGCRDVMEAISTALGDEREELPEVIKSCVQGTRSMSKEDRIRILRRAFKLLTHPAKHADEVAASIEWGPEDAQAAIVMAAALLKLAGEAG